MAPTIGRQWRGGTQDYAALCDYCDVRYLRSQLKKQSNGRLACMGPGTNGCGAGHDEIGLDKINADRLRHRRRPEKHRGGRFDRIRATVSEIFGAQLIECWDATAGVVSTSEGKLTSWTGQRLGAVFTADAVYGDALFRASVPEFYGRPGIKIQGGPEVGATWVSLDAFAPAGARLYMAAVQLHDSDAGGGFNGAVLLSGTLNVVSFARSPGSGLYNLLYRSAAVPIGTLMSLPISDNPRHAHLIEADCRGLLTFRSGTTEAISSVDSPTNEPGMQMSLFPGGTLTLLVLCNAPTDEQVRAFGSLARSFTVMRP